MTLCNWSFLCTICLASSFLPTSSGLEDALTSTLRARAFSYNIHTAAEIDEMDEEEIRDAVTMHILENVEEKHSLYDKKKRERHGLHTAIKWDGDLDGVTMADVDELLRAAGAGETAKNKDHLCEHGLLASASPSGEDADQTRLCCAAECGSCGGSGCSRRPGGSQRCCAGGGSKRTTRWCDYNVPPCIVRSHDVASAEHSKEWLESVFAAYETLKKAPPGTLLRRISAHHPTAQQRMEAYAQL